MDQTPFIIPLIEAIAHNYVAVIMVNQIYEQNKADIYPLSINHKYYNHPFFDAAGIDFAITCRRVLGVYLYLKGDILPIIKKGWRRIARYIMEGKFSSDHFFKSYLGDDEVTDNQAVGKIVVAIYLLEHRYMFEEAAPLKELISSYSNLLEAQFVSGKNITNEIPVEIMTSAKIFLEQVEKIAGFRLTSLSQMPQLVDPKTDIFGSPMMDLFLFFLMASELEGVNAMVIDSPSITREDILEVIAFQIKMKTEQAETNGERTQITLGFDEVFISLIPALLIRLLTKTLKHSQQLYFRDSSETTLGIISDLEKRLSALHELLSQTKRQTLAEQRAKADLQNQLSSTASKLEQQDRTIDNLQSQLQDEKAELIALRNLAFNLSNDDDEDLAIEETPPIIPTDIRVLICGGRPNWQRRLREILPSNFSFLPVSLSFDPTSLRNHDWLLIYPGSISHAYYERIMTNRPEDVNLGYLSSQNIDKTLYEISTLFSSKP